MNEAKMNLFFHFLVHLMYYEAHRERSSCNVFKSINTGFTRRGTRVLSNWAVPLYVILFHSCIAYKNNYKCVHLCVCMLTSEHAHAHARTHRCFSAGTHTGKQPMLVVNLSKVAYLSGHYNFLQFNSREKQKSR
jgi:hypothetical protein